jgi:hypothetical protein
LSFGTDTGGLTGIIVIIGAGIGVIVGLGVDVGIISPIPAVNPTVENTNKNIILKSFIPSLLLPF